MSSELDGPITRVPSDEPRSDVKGGDVIGADVKGIAAQGFADPAIDSAQVFRAIMDAMAHPGVVVEVPLLLKAPEPLSTAAAAMLLTLADSDAPVWVDPALCSKAVQDYLRFHCGAVPCEAEADAVFALGTCATFLGDHPFAIGTPEYPDRSTTCIIEVSGFETGTPVRLSGPGIADHQEFHACGLCCGADFARTMQANHALYPLGRDFIFTHENRFAAIPRSTVVEAL
ncbi:MAG: phosphonate C-P lyase system protein PhnH [Neomegalonema sp.]|nr:phosphonate C-P lyase system protein PhnH [Neomegalonema sp.]